MNSSRPWSRGPWNALHDAADSGSVEQTRAVLSARFVHVNQGTPDGYTPLILATVKGFAPVVQVLLTEGANVSVAADQGFTALHAASQEGHLNIARLLLGAGANLEAQTCDGLTPLHCAQRRGSVKFVKALIEAGANVNARLSHGETPLYDACLTGQSSIVKVLLRSNANPLLGTKAIPGSGAAAVAPLEVAAQEGHLDVVRELVRRVGIEGCGGSLVGEYALAAAERGQQVEIMRVLMGAGVVDAGFILSTAAKFGREASVKFLLQQRRAGNAGKNSYLNRTRYSFGKSPLLDGVEACLPRIVRLLIDAGADTTSSVQVTHAASKSRVVLKGTPLFMTELFLRDKYVCGEAATEEQLHRLTAIRRLLMQVDAVHAVSLLWPPISVPYIVRAAPAEAPAPAPTLAPAPVSVGERTPATSAAPLTAMFPILRERAGRRGVLLAAQMRFVLP